MRKPRSSVLSSLFRETAVEHLRPTQKRRKKPFEDLEFRRAIHHVLNKKAMDSFFGGLGVIPNNTPIHPVLKPWHNPNIPMVEFNVAKARQILKDAGYSWDDKGRLCFKG